MKVRKFILSAIFLTSLFGLNAKDLPDGYKNIKLGMSLDDTKAALIKDPGFGYHGDRDVSLLPGVNKVLIETDATTGIGSPFLERCWFQFSEDQLYIITINVNPAKMDYYNIFTTLCNKYGEPDKISPESATWKNDEYTMSLEKPLALKYMDNKIFDSLKQYSNVQKSGEEITRQMFLDEL